MSAWLSGANRVAGAASSQVRSAAKREVASAQADVSRQIVDFWTAGLGGGKKPRR